MMKVINLVVNGSINRFSATFPASFSPPDRLLLAPTVESAETMRASSSASKLIEPFEKRPEKTTSRARRSP